jgi:hypothetical protein
MATLKDMIAEGTMDAVPRRMFIREVPPKKRAPKKVKKKRSSRKKVTVHGLSGDFVIHGAVTGRLPARNPKRSNRPKRPRKSTLMYRAATKLQQRYRLALKALRTAKGIIEYVPPEVHERSDWLDDQKKLFAERCDDLGVK